jgi:hypothetical protein
MKKLVAILMVMCLAGCITATAKAPTGCENSFIWQNGFMPQGQDLVELGFAVLLTAEPQTISQVKAGAIKAWRLVQEGTLRGAVSELLAVLKKHPQYAPLAIFALQRLDLEKALDKCDQEVLLSMFHNIAVYAGAEDQDFSSNLANLNSLRQ